MKKEGNGLYPFCKACHKAFFVAAPAGLKTSSCKCKAGRKYIKEFFEEQAKIWKNMEDTNDPLEALKSDDPTTETENNVEN